MVTRTRNANYKKLKESRDFDVGESTLMSQYHESQARSRRQAKPLQVL